MSVEKVEIRNYRCFTDDAPLVIPLDQSVIAFVGPNNAGKTAALKAFYELRPLWQLCTPPSIVSGLGKNAAVGNFLGVKDNSEVFCNARTGPLAIDWELSRPSKSDEVASSVKRIRVSIDQAQRTVTIRIILWSGEEIPQNASLSWDERHEAFSWTNDKGALVASAPSYATAAARYGSCKFIPATRSASEHAQGNLYDVPQGAALAAEWQTLKTGDLKRGNNIAEEVERILQRLFGFRSLQINVTTANAFSIKIDGMTYRLSEIGNGFSHMLYAAIDVVNRPSGLILIDEPETGLHPALQREMLTFLAEKAGGHLYFATHSIGLARSFSDLVIGIHRDHGRLEVRPIEKLANYAEWLGELSFSTWSEIGFEAIILVEGPTELRALPSLLRELKLDSRVVLMSLGGSDFINASSSVALAEFKRMNCPVFVLIDSERPSDNAPLSRDRAAFVESCKHMGYVVHVLQRRALDNYVTEEAVKKVCRNQDGRALGAFERMRDSDVGWPKAQVPQMIAAMTFSDLAATDLGEFLSRVVSSVKQKNIDEAGSL
jgi:hypothetical protein